MMQSWPELDLIWIYTIDVKLKIQMILVRHIYGPSIFKFAGLVYKCL